jgi:hypothetical protein
LEVLLGEPCCFDANLALPGFHIFLAASLTSRYRDQLHLDLQHTYLHLDADLLSPTITFTLPLRLPKRGAGIEFCEMDAREVRGRLRVEAYSEGELLVHSGRALHRRAHFPASTACTRVTMQGHGVLIKGCWHLYW